MTTSAFTLITPIKDYRIDVEVAGRTMEQLRSEVFYHLCETYGEPQSNEQRATYFAKANHVVAKLAADQPVQVSL